MSKSSLNGLDWQLLELLQENGRMTISELAKRLSRSRSSVAEHLDKLRAAGVISGISASIEEEKLGFGISALVRLQADSSRHREIINTVTSIPEVAECHVLTGAELLIIRMVARNMAHLRELVDGLTRFGATHTDVIFSTVKNQLKVDEKLRKALVGSM